MNFEPSNDTKSHYASKVSFEPYNSLHKLSQDDKTAVLKIMFEAFPKNEIRGKTRQEQLFDNEFYQVIIIKESGKTIGFMAFWDFHDFVFYEHFAVDKTARNRGIGKATLEKLIEISDGRPMFLEVELPQEEMAIRRLNFYKRNGFDDNDFEYYQMPLNVSDEKIQMHIMSRNIELTQENFKKYKKIIYKNIYEIEEKQINQKRLVF